MVGRHRARSYLRLGTAVVATGATVAGILTAMAGSSGAANAVADARTIVVNGDFPTPHVAATFQTVGTGGAIGAWTVSAGNVDVNANSEWQGVAGDPTTTQSIDLSGTGPGAISQSLATHAGAHYTGSVEVATNPNCGTPVKTATLTVGSLVESISLDSTGRSNAGMGWNEVPFSFVASGASSLITFTGTTPGQCGLVITDVIVDPPFAPVIGTAPNLRVLQTTPAGTPVSYTKPSATDPNNGNAALPVTCAPASGSVFPVGIDTVTCSTSAPSGLSASSTFTVTVVKVVGACEARGLGLTYKTTISFDQSNPATTPCITTAVNQPVASATLVAGLLGLGASAAHATVLNSSTSATYGPTHAQVSAVDDIGALTFTAPGISVSLTAIHSQAAASLNLDCTGASSGSSYITGLVANGKHYTIGSAPVSIPLGLGIYLNLNQHIVSGNTVTQRAFSITSVYTHNAAYNTVIGESVAGLACG